MTVREEQQVCILWFAQEGRAVRQALDLLARGLPEQRGVTAHQKGTKALGRARQVEQVPRVHVGEYLSRKASSCERPTSRRFAGWRTLPLSRCPEACLAYSEARRVAPEGCDEQVLVRGPAVVLPQELH